MKANSAGCHPQTTSYCPPLLVRNGQRMVWRVEVALANLPKPTFEVRPIRSFHNLGETPGPFSACILATHILKQ